MTANNPSSALPAVVCLFLWFSGVANAFPVPARGSVSSFRIRENSSTTALYGRTQQSNNEPSLLPLIKAAAATAALSATLTFSSLPVQAFEASDYASETVKEAVRSLKDAEGNPDKTFSAYEGIAAIITEGKGVGGQVNYEGVQLERGYISDEDTSIYNPGLSLLTESEKERLVKAVMDARKAGLDKSTWTENNQVAYEFLKEKLDPLHMTELKGYLGIVPIYGAVLYLGTLAVQQFARDLFPIAYIVSAVAIFGPAAVLILLGSQ